MLHDSLHPANFSASSISFPKPVLIQGIWWSSYLTTFITVWYNTINNISNSKQLWTLAQRSNNQQLQIKKNVTVTYFAKPIFTNSIMLQHNNQNINFVSNLSMIPGYRGNNWVEGSNTAYPFEIELYGCENYNLETGERNFLWVSLIF